MTTFTVLNPVSIARTVFPLSTSHTLAVPSSDPLTTRPPSRLQHTRETLPVCPTHLAMPFPVPTSHNLPAPSRLPLATFFPSGDNPIAYTVPPPSRQSFPICFPLCKSHTRSEPSQEPVIIPCPPGT